MKRLDRSSVATLIFTFTMTITLGLMALYIGFDWQHTLFLLKNKLFRFAENEALALVLVIAVIASIYSVMSYILYEVLKLRIPSWMALSFYIPIELLKLYFLIMASFIVVTYSAFHLSEDKVFTSTIFFNITLYTFMLSSFLYSLFKGMMNKIMRRRVGYQLAKKSEQQMLHTFEINGIMNALVIIVTVLLLADTIGNAAYENLLKQTDCNGTGCNENTSIQLDDFLNSRIFSLMIPSLAVYIMSIKFGFLKGFRKQIR